MKNNQIFLLLAATFCVVIQSHPMTSELSPQKRSIDDSRRSSLEKRNRFSETLGRELTDEEAHYEYQAASSLASNARHEELVYQGIGKYRDPDYVRPKPDPEKAEAAVDRYLTLEEKYKNPNNYAFHKV